MGATNGQPDSRQEAVEAYWQEVEDDRADDKAQPEPGDGQANKRDEPEPEPAGVGGHGRQPERLNGRGDIPEAVKERAADDYANSNESMSTVAARYGMSRYTLSGYLREHIRKYQGAVPPDLSQEQAVLGAVINSLEGQPPEVCKRILEYAASYKGVNQ